MAKKMTKKKATKKATRKMTKKAAKKTAKKTVKKGNARRTTHRSSAGKKLYAVRDAGGQFKDIQTYERAHAADMRQDAAGES